MTIPSFNLGLEDCVNLYAIVIFLLFFVFLSYARWRGKNIFLSGGAFLVGYLWAYYGFLAGGFDPLIGLPEFYPVLRSFFILLGGIFTVMGYWSLLEWYRYRRGIPGRMFFFANKSAPVAPSVSVPVKPRFSWVRKIGKFFQYFLIFPFIGILAAILATMWPPHFLLYVYYYTYAQQQDILGALSQLMVYVLAYNAPLVILYVGFAVGHKKVSDLFSGKIGALIRLMIAAVYFAVGLGTMHLFLFEKIK